MIPMELSMHSRSGSAGQEVHVVPVPHLAVRGSPRQALRLHGVGEPPRARCTIRFALVRTTLDSAPVRLGGAVLASVKSYQVVPHRRRLMWRMNDCAPPSWTWA